jgi:lipopolysaccharide/colanic/teichoic acid biosynthesis glycosyltransferase
MRDRVEHDLYYIDNWSLAFDAYIMLLTVLLPKSYRNAR